MSEDKKQHSTDPVDRLQEALNQLGVERLNSLRDLREIQITNQMLLQQEAVRLEQKLGADHPRVKQVRANQEDNLRLVRGLEASLEVARIKVPEVPEDDALVQGRVVDENARGLAGLSVVFSDEKGEPLRPLGRVETDASGYFAFQLDKKVLGFLEKMDVYLTLYTRVRKEIYRHPEPIKVTAGDRLAIDIVLKREDLRPSAGVKPGGKEPVKKKPSKPNVWVVRGKVSGLNKAALAKVKVILEDEEGVIAEKLPPIKPDEKDEFTFILGTDELPELFEAKSELRLRVVDAAGRTLFTSRRRVSPEVGRIETIDIKVGKPKPSSQRRVS